MSGKTWVAGDHHFGHNNIIVFKDNSGNRIRPFSSIEEHDEVLIERHNAIVSDQDRVYMLGDVAINRHALKTLKRLKGRLVLVKGNHDIAKLKEYLPYFDDIRSCVVGGKDEGRYILSHIPIHPDCLGRFNVNIHGHLHQNKLEDKRYICVSLEHTNFSPIEIHQALRLQ